MTRQPISAAMRLLANRQPDAPAVRDRVEVLDRATLWDRAARYATILRESGVAQNDLVSILLDNGVGHVVATIAVWIAGATPQPLSPRLPAEEQRAIVALAGSRLVIGAAPGELDAAGTPIRVVPAPERSSAADAWSGPDLAAASWKAPTSSGSTGLPKIVVATAPAMVDPDAIVAPFIPRGATQLVVAPLSHSAPFTYAYRGLMTGHELIIEPRFEPRDALAALEQHRVTWTMLVPTMMHRMLRLPATERAAADLSALESILHIGAPCPPAVKRGWIDWIGAERVVEVYAGSESAGLTMIRGDEWLGHPGSVGRPISGSKMRIVDDDGRELPPGVSGVVQMTRPGDPPYRYLGADSSVMNGWHTLGDMGHLDGDGYLYLDDRRADLIVVGGEKVVPAVVERIAEAHPAVRSAVAVGVPDEDLGQVVGLVLDIDVAGTFPDDVVAWMSPRLAPAARPRRVVIHDGPLRDDAGKVRRRDWSVRLADC